MSNIPFEKQRLTADPIDQIEDDMAQGNAVSGDRLLRAIEWSEGHQLDQRLRNLLLEFSNPRAKRRGRRPNCKGREDFALEELDHRYTALLPKYQDEAQQRRQSAEANGIVLPSAEQSPSELAYRSLLRKMQADFPNIDWKALRNKHSKWKNGRFHSSDNHVDSVDFEAEIEQQFPS